MVSFIKDSQEWFSFSNFISCILGIALSVSVFLPWVSISFGAKNKFFGSYSCSGFAVNEVLGAIGLISGIIIIGASFIKELRVRAGVQGGAAVAAILTFLATQSSSPNIEFSGTRDLNKIFEMFSQIPEVEVGYYIFLGSALAMSVYGLGMLFFRKTEKN